MRHIVFTSITRCEFYLLSFLLRLILLSGVSALFGCLPKYSPERVFFVKSFTICNICVVDVHENDDTNHEVWAFESNAQRYAVVLPCNFGCSGVRL